MLDPIRAVMLATIIAFVAGSITNIFVPTSSEWVLATGACGFMGTLAVQVLFWLREQ